MMSYQKIEDRRKKEVGTQRKNIHHQSSTTNRRMNRIPAPNDSYDHDNSTVANLTSLRAVIASFEATINSLDNSIETLLQRLSALSHRAQTCACHLKAVQAQIHAANDHDGTINTNDNDNDNVNDASSSNGHVSLVKITCPALYETATGLRDLKTSLTTELSVLAKARNESQKAIAHVLLEEAQLMQELYGDLEHDEGDIEEEEDKNNGDDDDDDHVFKRDRTSTTTSIAPAKPADMWLDRASAFQQDEVSQFALQMNAVPPLITDPSSITSSMTNDNAIDITLHKPLHETESVEAQEGVYYKKAMERGQQGVLRNGDDDAGSVYTQGTRGTLMSNYSMTSHATASHRWQQRKMAAAHAKQSHHHHNHSTGGSSSHPNGLSSLTDRSETEFRNRKRYGSLTYLCDMLQDTYGRGSTLSLVQGDDILPPMTTLTDLVRVVHSNESESNQRKREGRGDGSSSGGGMATASSSQAFKTDRPDLFSTPKRQLLVKRANVKDDHTSNLLSAMNNAKEKEDSGLFQLAEDDASLEDGSTVA